MSQPLQGSRSSDLPRKLSEYNFLYDTELMSESNRESYDVEIIDSQDSSES